MTTLSRDKVIDVVGEVDDMTVVRILHTGASVDDLREALTDLEFFYELGEKVPLTSTSLVARVREILEPAIAMPLEGDGDRRSQSRDMHSASDSPQQYD